MPREGFACSKDDSVSSLNLALASKASPFLEMHAVLKPKSLFPNTVPVIDVFYHFFHFPLKHLLHSCSFTSIQTIS